MSIPLAKESSTRPKTRRQMEKEHRHRELLSAAADLFGSYGYSSVSLDDIGSKVGVSGQAIYRHFRGKQDLLGTLLIDTSLRLLEGGRAIAEQHHNAEIRMRKLINFHVDFALHSPEIIRVQEQEMIHLQKAHHHEVRRMQREYADIWAAAILESLPKMSRVELRTRIHGVFGLINSTAHSRKHLHLYKPSDEGSTAAAATLTAMAQAAIDCRL